jgi:hypothetical protein
MPYSVKFEAKLKRGKQYTIVEHLRGGRTEVVGHSGTRERAKASIRARLAREHGWKPAKRRPSK